MLVVYFMPGRAARPVAPLRCGVRPAVRRTVADAPEARAPLGLTAENVEAL